jgi:hypothetical protein
MNLVKKIIDNKTVLLTQDEYKYYQKLCREYDRPNFKGEQLFVDHFESSDDGIILFVKPPSKKFSSLEVYCFLVSLMVNQHLRIAHDQVNTLVREASEKYGQMLSEIKELKEKVEAVEEPLPSPKRNGKARDK